jgi:hypothetical protein
VVGQVEVRTSLEDAALTHEVSLSPQRARAKDAIKAQAWTIEVVIREELVLSRAP